VAIRLFVMIDTRHDRQSARLFGVSESLVRFVKCCCIATTCLIWVGACAARAPGRSTVVSADSSYGETRQGPASAAVTTITREASYDDSELAARSLGRLEVVVRSTDRPTQALPGALVLIRVSPHDSVRRLTDDRGVAVLDSLKVGDIELIVRRIGYGEARTTVPIKPGCRTDAEAYIAISALGISPPPPMPGRVTITTCR
jgi:hypothetical protein